MKRFLGISLLAAAVATAANAQTSPVQGDMMQQLQKIMGKKSSQQALGQALVIGSMLGCTQKTAGKEATNTFYSEMKAIGNTVESYCKQGYTTEARALVLSTLAEQKDHDVTKSALGCYEAQEANIETLGGKRMAQDAALYARWVRDPALAEGEIKESDICRKTTAAKPLVNAAVTN